MDHRNARKQRRVERVLRERWQALQDSGVLADAFVFRGTNLYPAIRPYVEGLYTNVYPRLVAELRIRKMLMESMGVTCAAMNTDCVLSKKVEILAARTLGIPSLAVQHGVNGEPNGERRMFADHAAVWGKASYQWYAHNGNDPARVHVTGNPKYDSLLRRVATSRIGNRDRIVFAAQVAPMRSACDTSDEERVYAREVVDVFRAFPGEKFVIKLHPRQSDEMVAYYRDLVAGASTIGIVRDANMADLLAEARVLITESSTVGFEAVLLGVSILTLNLTNREDSQPYGRHGVAVSVRDGASLKEALAEMLRNPRVAEGLKERHNAFAAEFLHGPDGRASERLLELCTKIATNGHRG